MWKKNEKTLITLDIACGGDYDWSTHRLHYLLLEYYIFSRGNFELNTMQNGGKKEDRNFLLAFGYKI